LNVLVSVIFLGGLTLYILDVDIIFRAMLFLTKISSRIIHEMVLTIGSWAYLENMGGYNRKRWRWYFYTKHRDVVGITFSLEVAISYLKSSLAESCHHLKLLDLIKKFKHIVSFYLYFCKLNLLTVIIQETRRFYFVFKIFVPITHFLIVTASTGEKSSLLFRE
jgi:hypothetical protein